jgi:Fic family protein
MNKIQLLPPQQEIETKAVLKKAAEAHRYLAELKGIAETIPNEQILINMLTLQEAKDSSAVENIITTHDELFKAELFATSLSISSATKEVQQYASALKLGFEKIRHQKLLTVNHIIQIQQELEGNNAGFRKTPGTSLINQQTNEVVYTPPQHPDEIVELMSNLALYINDDSYSDADPLVKMAVIHHQFESIHPFYDGNGRTGRIINILYLVIQDLLTLPILYLSRYIIREKADYYRYLQEVRDSGNWENWLLFMLEGVVQTAQESIELVKGITKIMQQHKQRLRRDLPNIYSQDLVNNLFRHPYTKVEFLMQELGVSRITATKYLDLLVQNGFLEKRKIGRSAFYINITLWELFIKNKTNV